mgnify:CR=1 FL=1
MPECAECRKSNTIKGENNETITRSFFKSCSHRGCPSGLQYGTGPPRKRRSDCTAFGRLETTKLQKESLEAAAKTTQNAAASEEAASDASAADTDDTTASPYLDGTYEGEAEGFGGMITVQVTVKNGQMTDLSILSADGEDSAYLSNAKDIIPKILEAQSADVDTISGATFSSTGIKNATAEALEKAEK